MTPRALVRRPGPRLADGLVTHIERQPADLDLAAKQWESYVAALREHGWETIEVAAADDCPDSVFVEDTVVVVAGRAAVLTRPGAPSRRGEGTAGGGGGPGGRLGVPPHPGARERRRRGGF